MGCGASRGATEPDPPPAGYVDGHGVEYVHNMFARRTKADRHTATPERFGIMLLRAGENQSKPPTLFEVLEPDREGRVFFDYDRYVPSRPSDTELEATMAELARRITSFMAQADSSGTFDASFHGCAAQRHRPVVSTGGEQRFKISFRVFLDGYKVEPRRLKAAMEASGLFGEESGVDLSVYPTNAPRLLGCVNCAKGKDNDMAPLRPLKLMGGGAPEVHRFVVQYVQPHNVLLFKENIARQHVSPHTPFHLGTPHTPLFGGGVHSGGGAGGGGGAYGGSPALTVLGTPGPADNERAEHLEGHSQNQLILKVLTALAREGMSDGFMLHSFRGDTMYFKTCPGGRTCMQGEKHDSNNFVVRLKPDGTLQFHCFSTKCKAQQQPGKSLGRWKEVSTQALFDFSRATPAQLRRFSPLLLKEASDAARALAQDDPQYKEYEAFLDRYYNHHLVFVASSVPEILQIIYDDDMDQDAWIRRTVEGSRQVFMNCGDTFKVWLQSPQRRTVRGYQVQYDGALDPDLFNLACASAPFVKWDKHAFSVDEMMSEEYHQFQADVMDTILTQVCSGDRVQSDYLIKWAAHTLQRKGVKVGTMIWLCGEQGTGKGWFWKLMANMMGKTFIGLNSLDQLIAKFNQHLTGKLLVHVDEACFNGTSAQADAIKNRVTETEMMVESKFKDAEVVASTFNLGASTNHMQPIKLDPSDRRHVFIQTNKLNARDSSFWGPRFAAIFQPRMLEHTYRWLMNVDISGWDARALPATALRAENQLASRPMLAWYVEEAVGKRWELRAQLGGFPIHVFRSCFLDEYNKWLALKQGLGHKVPDEDRVTSQDAITKKLLCIFADTGTSVTASTTRSLEALGYLEGERLPVKAAALYNTYKFPPAAELEAALRLKNWWGA